MRKPLLYALAATFALGVAETTPAFAEPAATAPRSLDELRAQVRGEAMTALAAGETEQVRHRRYHRGKRYHRRYHRRGRWCGYRAWYGKRCYYTPRVLRPFRQR